ncbi:MULTISPECIES: alpha/beta fold hydrolase [unclassified Streptomyces]|uniref:alpha/beta fold hydrolase n=1 Tax=unclassified Streptomyces TaxID=2593676 RepID=UPI0035E1FDF7
MSETFVLIHGAWHGGWAWNAVAPGLRAKGHRVLTPTMPGLGIDDDPRGVGLSDAVQYLIDYVERRDLNNITLIAHSWGGFVASGAATALAHRIRRMVFWSAFVPHDGESMLDACPPEYRQGFVAQAERAADRTVVLSLDVWRAAFMQDAPAATQGAVYNMLRPQPFATLDDPARQNRFFALEIPTCYILSTDDKALPQNDRWGWQRFAERLADPLVISLPGSHESCFTRPEELTRAFLTACERR